ncbi:MAG TPA: anti-sigma factor [Aggregatilineales bacterium]|nr:anti-sigma factor [Aggregatilineales bacterium]
MNCAEIRHLLDPYMDGELDLVRSLEIDEHLQGCPDCSGAYAEAQALQTAMHHSSLYATAPTHLRQLVQVSLRQANRVEQGRLMLPRRWMPALSVAAALVVGIVITLGVSRLTPAPSADDLLAQDVLSSHLRSLMVDHLADVASTDQHTVKPWFNGKLNFSPPVVDLADQGFPLIGGRLDYLDNRAVAALVYQRRKHVINLFIWPAANNSETNTVSASQQGYQIYHWQRSGMIFWAVSDVASTDLSDFVQLFQNQTSPPATP